MACSSSVVKPVFPVLWRSWEWGKERRREEFGGEGRGVGGSRKTILALYQSFRQSVVQTFTIWAPRLSSSGVENSLKVECRMADQSTAEVFLSARFSHSCGWKKFVAHYDHRDQI